MPALAELAVAELPAFKPLKPPCGGLQVGSQPVHAHTRSLARTLLFSSLVGSGVLYQGLVLLGSSERQILSLY